uniref:Cyclin D3b n=1 Tax=Antirrhinum majus TaxID=4151 RepID=Q9SNV0_ANTMA|nr:cyclin D3b [Antirrhinum majus]
MLFSHSQQTHLQNPIFDALLCNEEHFDEDLDLGSGLKDPGFINQIHHNQKKEEPFTTFLFEHDLLWEDDELVNLLSKEKEQEQQAHLGYDDVMDSDGFLKRVRNEGIKWMLKVIGHYGFNAMTAVLAVNYYDRFITNVGFQKDKPWMSQLAAVACLSVKVEETQVPLLLDFQVEESKYVFEAKTIQRMELLVLTTLKWKMNPVTPISFFDHIVRRFELMNNVQCEFMKRCESVILSIITDYRFVRYLPSVVAAATMIYVIKELYPCDALEYQNEFVTVLRTSKEKTDDCHMLITEVINNQSYILCHKRKYGSIPSSPNGVIDAYFSSDGSNDSWSAVSSVSSSPEPVFKRIRAIGGANPPH